MEKQISTRQDLSSAANITLPKALRKTEYTDHIIEQSRSYAELSQVRETIIAGLRAVGGNSLLVASPCGNAGTSILAATLGYYTAYSCREKVLLVDCDVCRPKLHSFFNLSQAHGLAEFAQHDLSWRDIVKDTGTEYLYIITAGTFIDNFSTPLRHFHIQNLFKKIRNQFDLIIFDTSPVLNNNVNITSLSSVVDYFLLLVSKSVTTKGQLKKTQNIIEAGNGHIDGIIINNYVAEKSWLNRIIG